MTYDEAIDRAKHEGCKVRHPDMTPGFAVAVLFMGRDGLTELHVGPGEMRKFVPGLIETERKDWYVITTSKL